MNDKKKNNIIIGSLCAVVLLMAVGYAAFQSALNIEGTSNITSSWNIKITGITSKNIVGTASNNGEPTFEDLTATFKTNLVSPGDSIEYDITVKNAGTLNAKLDKITLSDTNNPAIKFTSSGLTEGDILNAGNTTTLTVKVEFLASVTEIPESKTSTLTVALDYSQSTGEGSGGSAAADLLKENVVTTGDGLYEDTTEAGRYVYRGAAPSNYITFNNEVYRIMSVEADNTIKIISEGSRGRTMAFDTPGSRPQSEYCDYSQKWGCGVWGSKSTMLDANGQNVTNMKYNINSTNAAPELPTGEASLNTYLNGTYYNSLTEEAKGQITSHAFNAGTLFGATSQTLEADVSQVKANTWNGNVGLMDATDYVKASTNSGCINVKSGEDSPYPCKNENYLYKSAEYWWTISPYSGLYSYYVWVVNSSGDIRRLSTHSTSYARPVMFLKPDIALSGEGTSANPYTID